MKDLSLRLLSSLCAGLFIACMILFSSHPVLQYVVVFAIGLIASIAIWEYEKLAALKGAKMILSVLITITSLGVLSFFVASKIPHFKWLPVATFFLGFVCLFGLHFKQKEGAVVDLAVSLFGLLYIAVPMGMLLGVLYIPSPQDGRWWIAYLLIVTKMSDVGGYFAGNLWGKRKLAPQISPGKTIEGSLAGLFFSVLASYAFYRWVPSFSLTAAEWISFGFLLGIVGQFGDLAESLLKRDANKKDSNSLPGLGGILDTLDSILFNSVILYIYLTYFKS